MFGPLGVPEILFLLVLALLIFGPRKLPEIGRTLGRGLSEFRKASNELRRTLNAEAIEQELRESDPRRIVKDALVDKPSFPASKQKALPEDSGTHDALISDDDKAEKGLDLPGETVARGSAVKTDKAKDKDDSDESMDLDETK